MAAQSRNEKKPKAVNGFLDLSHWNMQQETVPLNGEWNFYWNRLLEPKDFSSGKKHSPVTTLTVTGIWNKEGFSANGSATLLSNREGFLVRFIDSVTARGKTDPAEIREVIGKRSDRGIERQIVMLPAYEKSDDEFQIRQYG